MFNFQSRITVLTLHVIIRATVANSDSSAIPSSQNQDTERITTEPKIIVYGMSYDDDEPKQLECECVLFSECSNENFIQLPTAFTNGEECSIPDICCKRPDPPSPPVLQPSEPTPTNNNKVINNELSEDHELEEVECKCMAFYLCPSYDITELSTNFNKKNRCSIPEVCCKKTNSQSSAPSPSSISKDGSWKISFTIKHNKEIKCNCVPSHQCPTSDIMKTSTFLDLKCSNSDDVCCKAQGSSENLEIVPEHIPDHIPDELNTMLSNMFNSQNKKQFFRI